MEVEFISGWADHPLLVKAFAHRTRAALNKARTSVEDKVAVLFTAHSVPSRTVLPSSKPVEYHGMVLANGPDSYADIDIAFQQTAGRLGLTLVRAESLNDSPLLIDALEDLALHNGKPRYALVT
ncbi:MAG: ferrochelatase [Edaphobacter sp.]|nr:ferrochelatase [Edaphobacter sp.]